VEGIELIVEPTDSRDIPVPTLEGARGLQVFSTLKSEEPPFFTFSLPNKWNSDIILVAYIRGIGDDDGQLLWSERPLCEGTDPVGC
jgi:hypothetical protein